MKNAVKEKKRYAFLLILVAAAILLLTFQSAEGTVKLSEGLRLWAEHIGIHSDFRSFRSNAHLIEYFVLGVVLGLYGWKAGRKWYWIILAGCAFGLLDETIKVLLPTREFDAVDLIKDWIGVFVGTTFIWLIAKKRG